jgi:Tfp pilus assembly protein PilN
LAAAARRLRRFAPRVYSFHQQSEVMSTRLNLASNPFRNRVLPWTVTALVAISSIAALLFIAQSTFKTYASISSTQTDVTNLRKQLDSLVQKEKAVEIALTPEQKRQLKYTHGLVDRKGFSWSRLFADLEASLPGEIRVTKIRVKGVGVQDGRPVADLDLVVASKSPSNVTQMIEEMESQGTFHAELESQNPQRGKGETGSEYELNVHYVPRAGFAIERSVTKPPVDTAKEGGKTR